MAEPSIAKLRADARQALKAMLAAVAATDELEAALGRRGAKLRALLIAELAAYREEQKADARLRAAEEKLRDQLSGVDDDS